MTNKLGRVWVAAVLMAGVGGVAWAAKPNEPMVSIPLEPLGFVGIPARFLMTRATMYTVHFVDGTHVLLTFNARSLLSRLPDADPDDDDRNVTALVLELPTGKVVARTEWRTRDHDQYLWALGHGRFLLRIRTKLSVIEPGRRLGEAEPFRQENFLDTKRPIGFVSVSAGGELLTVETVPRVKKNSPNIVGGDEEELDPEAAERNRRVPVQMHFYRLLDESKKGEAGGLKAVSSGVIYSPVLVNVPANADGYLDIKKEAGAVWDFDFKSHAGKKVELSAYDTTCAPRPYFISRSEFVAFGCRGSAEKKQLSGFNLLGEEPWVSAFPEQWLSPSIVPAPAAGRFALSRLTVSSAFVDADSMTPDMATGQEVAVYQNHDGRILMKVQTTPFQRSGQNFDLAEDGLLLAAVRGGNLEVYRLPELSGKDRGELKRIAAAEPERNSAPIALDSSPVTQRKEAVAEGVKVGAEVMQKSAGEVVQPPLPDSGAAPAEGNVVGDVPQGQRKAPSLYDAEHPKGK